MFLATMVALSISFTAEAAYDQEGILVGRIAHVDGKLLRYVDEGKDWVVTVKDTPFGLKDALYSGDNAKAEFIMPNKTWVRIGENTQVQLFALTDDATTLDVASGTARLYNKGRDVVCKVTTPFGYVVAPAGSVFDLYVGDESMEVIAVRGDVDVVHDASRSRYEVREGAASLIADRSGTARGNGTVDGLWDDWNGERDRLWNKRLQSSASTTSYLPEPIQEDSYVLEENGRWERVYYEGDYYNMWRPTRVDPGWRPFSAGRWTVYYGDNCWVPDEPFGYLTHHYGSWVFVDSFRSWYWLPPVRRAVVSKPHFLPAFGWYPGRVGWIHHGQSIGWVPLAPSEDYYGYNPWGRRTVVIKRTAVPALSLIRYRYLDAAVIIHRDHFYQGSRYTSHLQRNIGRAVIINNYQPVAVINNTVINNFDSNTRRFAFNDAKVDRKPHSMVVNRIVNNQQLVKNAEPLNRSRITQELTQVATAEPSSTATTQPPVLTSKLVEAQNVSKPLNTNALPKKEIKPRERQRQLVGDTDQASQSRPQKDGQRLRPERKDEQQRMQAAREARNQLMEQSAVVSRQANEPPPTAVDRVAPSPNTEQSVVPSQPQPQTVTTPPQQPTQQPIVTPDPRTSERQRLPAKQERATSTSAGTDNQRPPQRLQSPGEAPSQESRQAVKDIPRQEERPPSSMQQPVDQTASPPKEPESQRRIRSPKESSSQEIRRPGDETAGKIEQLRRTPNVQPTDPLKETQHDQQEQRRIRSPRETRAQEAQQHQPDLQRQQESLQRQQEEQQQRQQQEMVQRQQQEQQQRRQQQEALKRQQEEQQRRPPQQPQRKRTPQEEELLQQGQQIPR